MKRSKGKRSSGISAALKRRPPVGYTIMFAFLMFSLLLIVLLWVFQTVFLDSFYRSIKISQVKSTASQAADLIKRSGENDKIDITELSGLLSKLSEMSLLIYNTDESVYTKLYPYTDGGMGYLGYQNIEDHEAYRYYKQAEDNGGTVTEFIKEDLASIGVRFDGDSGEPGGIRYPYGGLHKDQFDPEQRVLESVIYAQIVETDTAGEYLIVIEARITPVTGTVETLRVQLVIITWILIFLSIVLAFITSRMIANPIVKINKNAKELAKQNYKVNFTGGAYREIWELNRTLNYATRELSKVEALRQELIANVSHDLRTPLTMIIGYGEVMKDLPGENTPENIQIIIDEATHLSTLVSDLLDLSKLQSGTMQIEAEEFSLTECVKNIFTRYSKLVGQDGFKIFFESDGEISVNADEIKITQVIYNLINNAINYSGEDKTVIVRQKTDKNEVVIEVEDHGKGIEADKLEFIWDRYYKVDKSHKSSVIGTGLGLSIVKNILDMHKAQYGVKSRLGAGSLFWFRLPYSGYEQYKEGKTVLCLNKEGKIESVGVSGQLVSADGEFEGEGSFGADCVEPPADEPSENGNFL